MIPRYIASGRMAPNGKVYGEVIKKNEDDLVPVRSIITKRSGDPNVVTPDLIGNRFKITNLSDGMAIGASFGTSLTENITQSLLALKHGGHERVNDLSGNLYAPKDCTFRIEGKWIILKVRGGELKYPCPTNWVGTGQEKFKEGDLIGSAYHTTSPAYRLNAIIKCMRARGSNGLRYFEKDDVIMNDCFAYNDGVIHYIEDPKSGKITVKIGTQEYDYSSDSIYYFPDGASVKKYAKICSGVINMAHVIQDTQNLSDAFNIFRRQFYTLNNAAYEKKGFVEPDWMQEEILELVFAGLIGVDSDDKGNITNIEYQGAHNSILNRDSFFTTLSYGYSAKVLSKALKGELNLNSDIMSNVVLGLLLNDKLDDKK